MALDTITRITMAALEAAVKARVPCVLVGAPGVGKTATIKTLAKKIGYELITIVGSQLDPTDITGLPKGEQIYEKEDGTIVYGTVYLSPWWQVRIHQKKKVLLFLDEFSNTPASVRASMLTMLQNREFPNGEIMPPETIVIGAMNPVEQAADGQELDLPTTNRLFFIPWSPSAASWYQGMLNAWGEKVSDNEMLWRTKIVAFVKDNPTWLHREPDDVGTKEAYGVNVNDPSEMEVFRSAWASRRSWDKLSQVLGHAPNDISVQDLIIQGLVGYAAAASFRDWLRKHDVIDPQQVISNPKSFNWKNMSLDDSNLVLRSIIDMVNNDNSLKVIEVFNVIVDSGRADLSAPFIQSLFKAVTNKNLSETTLKNNREAIMQLSKKLSQISQNSR